MNTNKGRRPLSVVASCDGCGACCTGQAALPVSWYVSGALPGDPATLPPPLRAELEALKARFLAEGFPPDGSPCVWYDAETRRCRHYECRPDICRDEVKVGDEACRRWRRALGIDPTTRYVLRGGRLVREEANR